MSVKIIILAIIVVAYFALLICWFLFQRAEIDRYEKRIKALSQLVEYQDKKIKAQAAFIDAQSEMIRQRRGS